MCTKATIIVGALIGAILLGGIVSNRPGIAQSVDSSEQILEKLNTVIRNEEEILSRLDAMKEELYVIKIRISKRG